MRINKKILGITALAVAVIVALLLLGLPPLVRHIAINKITESTGRSCQIEKVSLNPFKLTAEVSGVRLAEKGSSATFFSLSSARVSLSPLSLPKRSFIVKEVHFVSPYLHVVRDAPNHYNFTDLLTKKEPEKKKQGLPYFSLNNIVVHKGAIDFQDKALKSERYHRVRNMEIALPFVSDIPYLADRYVTPHFSAMVNDSPFRFDGRLKPLTRAMETTVSVNVKDVDLPFYLGYVPVPLPVKVASGKLGTDLEVGYRVDEKTGPEIRVSGRVALDKAAVKEPNDAPLVSLEAARLQIANAALISKVIDVAALELDGMELTATKERSGKWNFQRVFIKDEQSKAHPVWHAVKKGKEQEETKAEGGKGPAETAKEPAAEPAKKKESGGKPLQLKVAKLALHEGKVHLADLVPSGGFRSELHGVNLDVKDFSLARDHRTPVEFKFSTARRESAMLKGEFSVEPVEFRGTLDLNGIPLKDYYPYLSQTLTAPVSGTVSLSSSLLYANGNLVLDKTTLKGERLSAPFGGDEGVQLREAVISGIGLDLNKMKATVQRVDLRGGKVALTGYKGGGYSYQHLLKAPQVTAQNAPPAAGKRKKAAAGAPFSYRIEKVTGSDFGVRYTDQTNEEAPVFKLKGLSFAVSGITGPKLGTIPLTLSSGYGDKGRLHASGTVNPQPLSFKGTVQLLGIPLTDFNPYLPADTTVFVADGALDTTLALNLQKGSSGFTGGFSGSLGVRSFYAVETVYDEDLLKWESLQMDRISGTLSPFSLAVNEVALSNFYSRVIVERDGTLNLQHLEEKEGAAGDEEAPAQPPKAAKTAPAPTQPKAAAPAAVAVGQTSKGTVVVAAPGATTAAPAPAAEAAAQPHPIRIDTVTMQGGTLAFSDRHLANPFDTTFYNLGGRVSGLTSQWNSAADVDLRGNLENHSPLSIKGVINPLRGDLFLDLKIAFTDIELSPFTPYSNTFLGYTIDKGKLSLDLAYKIDKKALSSSNKVFIDQFTFGKAVESPKATKLPVRLAVALLKDRNGEIHLDLPVAGRTDDPKFSVWHVIGQILKNLLVKAATSPMALLGSMFGHGEDFSVIAFAPGSDSLGKGEQEKLAKISKALHDRPALNLEISGFVDRETDAEGYRNEMLVKKMKAEEFRRLVKAGKTKPGQTQEKTEIPPQDYSSVLKAVYQKEKFPKPRNALGFAKDLPDAEMKKLIVTHTLVGDNELRALARDRVETVKTYLVADGKVPAERLFEKSSDIYKPTEKGGPGSRVEFGANVK
ncbi:MAG TPA: DUF748 domain-containing protein [Geomonas sp.]|nr:DUF748 domain-containing protein [Geomonas sp.]